MSRLASHKEGISVIVPALHASRYIIKLLESIEAQTLRPQEVIIIDSSRDDQTELIVRQWQGTIPLVYRRLDFAYPGHARNIGVAEASYERVAFLDCRTIPAEHWLERSIEVMERTGADFVKAQRTSTADSGFKKILLAATYGGTAVASLSGSIVRRTVFLETGGFLPHVRAGEDIEWINRLLRHGAVISSTEEALLQYEGLPETLSEAVRKWYEYANANARIDVVNVQKVLYSTVFALFILLFIYKWNYLFAHWEREHFLFIPNITKGFLAITLLAYILFRGLIRPLCKKVKPAFLMPWRWCAVFFVGFCLDLAKAPGLILGAGILLRKKMTLFHNALKQKNIVS